MNSEHNQQELTDGTNSGTGYTTFSPVSENNDGRPKKHSGLGISSFILAILSILCIISVVFIAISTISDLDLAYSTQEEIERAFAEGSGVAASMSMVLIFLASLGLSFIGLILGIIGAVMKNRKKVFSIIGIIVNALMVLFYFIIFIIAMAASSSM